MTVTASPGLELEPGLIDWLDEREVRYELIDGCVVVSPPAGMPHEKRVVPIVATLYNSAPAGLLVLGSSAKVFYDGTSFVVPDASVVREVDAQRDDGVHVPPLLVVEIASRSTRRRDRGLKREIYAELGVPSYWLVEPVEGELTVLTLDSGTYAETGRGSRLELDLPYPVVIDLS